ncbi:zinc-ribbon domain-containing protein [Blastococcus sp. TF02A-30]|uniref:zinc-ribbon domain-containing protein n=1 Tax=Blastococcus sp. TF02A-30 TaxID=2250580 RepID=UPI000DE97008|nr:hypothetical protein DQ241_08300 [Blastococcus sp. TF02A-30]
MPAVAAEKWPSRWRDVDKVALTRLLASGLTPAEVGAHFGRSADAVRLLARRWQLDTRALRARSIGLAVRHPRIAREFLCVIDGAPPHYEAQDLLAGSGARCRWRCDRCGEEWTTSVANRTTRGSGCPACAARGAPARARSRPVASAPLAHAEPQLAREFVRNVSRPDRDALTTPSGSNDRIVWRCGRGHEWETAARQRARYRTQCPACLAGVWSSRLEHQVAELVQLATGFRVEVGVRRPRADRASVEHVDLLVVDAGCLVDLDPSRWHRTPSARARDLRKLERLAGERYVRIRPRRLGRLPGVGARPEQQVVLTSDSERDPWLWAAAVIRALETFCVVPSSTPPAPSDREEALTRADRRWRRLGSGVRERSLLSVFPAIAAQLVEVAGRPELTAADLAPSGDERAVWRCPDCLHTWEARVANRTVAGTGCPPCSYERGASRGALALPGASFADKHPELVQFFVCDETRPGRTLSELKPSSTDRCRWRCPHRGRPWVTTPHALHRRPRSGCRTCSASRSTRPSLPV